MFHKLQYFVFTTKMMACSSRTPNDVRFIVLAVQLKKRVVYKIRDRILIRVKM